MRLPGFARVLHATALCAIGLGVCWLIRVSPAEAQNAAPVFVPPPRSIADITAILDQEKPDAAKIAEREAATPGLARAEALRQAMLAFIDGPGMIDQLTHKPVYSYAHPIFWAPFSLVGDGGAS